MHRANPEGALSGVIHLHLVLSDEDVDRIAERTAELLAGQVRGRAPAQASPYMTIEEAASYLRCGRQRIYDLLSQRRLGRVKDGARTLIVRTELEAYLGRKEDARPARRFGSAA